MSDQQNWGQPSPEEYPANFPPPPPDQSPVNLPPPPAGQFPPAAPPYPPQGAQWAGGPAPWPGGPGPRPRRSHRWWWIGGAVFVVVALIAAGVTVVLLRGGSTGGADNPQAAVLDFLAAAEKSDAFAAADLLDPSEQAGVRQVLDNARNAAENTGFQQGGGPNGLLDGLHISTDNVQTSVTNVRDDLARVTITGGQITIGFDPAKANAGLRDLLVDKDQSERTWTADDMTMQSRSGDKLNPALMTVRRSGRWYVSVMYSYLDIVARKTDTQPSDPGTIDTETYDSPEDAAKGFANGIVSMLTDASVMDLAKTLSPEAGALIETYRNVFERKLKHRSVRLVGTPKFSADTKGDTATVKVEDLSFESTDSDGDTHQLRFHDGCVSTEEKTQCKVGESWLTDDFPLSPLGYGVIATRGAKGWHVDPVATYLNDLAEQLHNASKEDMALLMAQAFKAPQAFLRLDAQGELSMNSSKTVTLKKGGMEGIGYAIFDLPVKSGDRVTVAMQTSSGSDNEQRVWFMAVGKSGRLAQDYTYGSSYTATDSFTASATETVKVVAWGPADQSISIIATD